MQIQRDGRTYKTARITGPTHNYLSLTFAESESNQQLACVALPALVPDPNTILDSAKVQAPVLQGVAEASTEGGLELQLERLKFVSNDSPPESVYRLLARAIGLQAVVDLRKKPT